MWMPGPHFGMRQLATVPKGTCVVCKQEIFRNLLKKVGGEYICETCWEEIAKQVLEKLVENELRKRGIFNQSSR